MRHIVTTIFAAITFMSATTATAQEVSGEANLLGTAWLAEDIDGRGVIDRARSTLEFPITGQVAGLAACNRYFGAVSLTADTIAVGNLASTRKMCSESLMEQEQRFLAALSKAKRLELTHEGQILLVYTDNSTPILRFSKILQK